MVKINKMKKIKTELTLSEIMQLKCCYIVGAGRTLSNKRDERKDRKILKFISCLELKDE